MGLKDMTKSTQVWDLEVTPPEMQNPGYGDMFKITAYKNSGTSTDAQKNGIMFSYLCGWHHIAVTYDDDTGKMDMYFDYEKKFTLSLGEKLRFGSPAGHVYYVGGGINGHSFDGWVDEVRLVRECLTPDKFLRLTAEPGTKVMFW